MRRWITWVVVLVVVVGGGFAAWRSTRKEEKPAYKTEAIGRGDVTMAVTATGTLSAVTTVQVGSQVSGIIAKLYVDFNSRVTRGQLLAELDPTTYQAQVEQRRADLVQSEVQMRNNAVILERQKKLLEQQLVAQGDYDTAKANFDSSRAMVEQSRAALAQAQRNLDYTKIVSPVDGVVVDRQYDVGQTVAASFQAPTLFTIAQDLTEMQVQADVDQSDIGRVQVGQIATFTVDAYPEQEFRGEVKQIRLNATVAQNVITYPVIIGVKNPEEKLRPKMTADVSVQVAKVDDVLRVPNTALRFRPPQDAGEGGGPDATATARPGGAPGGAGTANAATTAAAGPRERQRGGQERANGTGEGRRGRREGGGEHAGPGGRPGRGLQTVYLLDPAGTLKPVQIKTGITDGRMTEVTGGELKEGDVVVVGLPTSRSAEAAGGGRRPGMRF